MPVCCKPPGSRRSSDNPRRSTTPSPGRTCCYCAPLNAALSHVTGGKAVALAISSAQRSPRVPGNLTIAQFTEFVKKELDETKKILDAAGIKPQ